MPPERTSTRRVFVIGAMGSGKTTFADELRKRTGLPVHHLDEVAREGGGTGEEHSTADRDHSVIEILDSQGWIAEGIHIGWTQPLMEAADSIVWLDHVTWRDSTGRQMRRFVRQAMAEARRQKGTRRFLRFRDYGRRLGELAAAIPESRRYAKSSAGAAGAGPSAEAAGMDVPTRAATAAALEPFGSKVIHCTTAALVEGALVVLTATGQQDHAQGAG